MSEESIWTAARPEQVKRLTEKEKKKINRQGDDRNGKLRSSLRKLTFIFFLEITNIYF